MPVIIESITPSADQATDKFLVRRGAGPLDHTIELLDADQARERLNVADGANAYVHPNHTGDVSSTGDGATVIAADAVTNAKLANVATATIKGRATAGTGDPEDLTGTQATALLDAFTSGAKGLAPASGGGTTNFLRADGTWAAPGGGGGVSDGDKGDITVSGSGATWTIDAGAVTLAKLADIATDSFLGRDTAGTGAPEVLTGAQAVAILRSASVVVAAPASDQANWAPAGFGAGTSVIEAQPTTNSFLTGISAGVANQEVSLHNDSLFCILLEGESSASTAANRIVQRPFPVWILPSESVTLRYEDTISRWVVVSQSRPLDMAGPFTQMFLPNTTTTIQTMGRGASTSAATISTVNPSGTPTDQFLSNGYTQGTQSTANGSTSIRTNQLLWMRGASANLQGFAYTARVRFTALGATSGAVRCGVLNSANASTNLNAALGHCVMLGADTSMTNLRIFRGDAAAGTPVDLGANFPVPSATAAYDVLFYAPPNASYVRYMVRRLDSRFVAEGSLTANLPGNTQTLGQRVEAMVGATGAANTWQCAYSILVGL